MLKRTWMSIVTAGMLAATGIGCSSIPQTVVRGQNDELTHQLAHAEDASWEPTKSQIQQVRGGLRPGERPMEGEIRGLVRNNLNVNEVSRGGYRTPVGANAQPGGPMMHNVAGPSPLRRWGDFDQHPGGSAYGANYGNCPPNHMEQCWDQGGRRYPGQYHYHTYRYKQPCDLVYPAPNQPAGVVTYPYYTHKGPSDFFMK